MSIVFSPFNKNESCLFYFACSASNHFSGKTISFFVKIFLAIGKFFNCKKKSKMLYCYRRSP